ncbi:efflux RND transporter periplasmic adaptor subunit [Rheinheimera tangshanensis]|nr:MexH family multidrug efflux RND transporter periplasmic adaptor subunit [Rheinheimera tangshanensis]
MLPARSISAETLGSLLTFNLVTAMKRFKSILFAVLGLICVFMVLAGVKGGQIAAMIESGETFVPPPEHVSTFVVEQQSWPNTYNAIGTVLADEGIIVAAEVPGRVKKISFSNGQQVTAGTVLIEQDVTNEQAQLRSAEASLKLAKTSYDRLVQLRRTNIATQSELDNAKQQLDSAAAQVDNLKATLQKKVIRAPFDGRIGIRQVDLGTDLQAGTPIVSLQATNKVRVNFPVPQHWLTQITKGLPVEVSVGDGAVIVKGEISAIGAEINTSTRNVIVQSILDNSSDVLIPGMAVSTTVTLTEPHQLLVVPSTAIIYAPFGDTVFVVEKDDKGGLKARQQFVRLGKARGDFVEVIDGLKAGEQVVSAGAFKLFNGQAVVLSKTQPPEFKATPTPADT